MIILTSLIIFFLPLIVFRMLVPGGLFRDALWHSVVAVLIGACGLFTFFALMPVLHVRFLHVPLFLAVEVVLALVLGMAYAEGADSDTEEVVLWRTKGGSWLLGLFVAGGFAMLFFSSPVFNASKYRALIGPVKEGNFQTDVELLDQSQVTIIDAGIAHRRAEELLGNDAGIGSRCHIGPMSRQSISGKLYYVAALEHSSNIRAWWNDSTPGYVIISATNPMDGRLVVNGKLRYIPSGILGHDLERHIWLTYPDVALADFTFHLDDEMRPWWVATTYENTIGILGRKPSGAIFVNPETGEMTPLAISAIPAKFPWADRIQPHDMVISNLDSWGEYAHGWLASTFFGSGDELLRTTHGTELVYTKSGRSMWYTGISAKGRDNGTVGFMLVDSTDGAATLYHIAGATEEGGKHTIEGKVQQFGYSATYPILYNIHGHASYISTLKDKAGNFKMIGITSVQNRALVAVGNNIQDALRSYLDMLNNVGGAALDPSLAPKQVVGKVTHVATETVDGRTNYLLITDGLPHRAFILTSATSRIVPFVTVGQTVTITYNGGLTDYNPASSLVIEGFHLDQSEPAAKAAQEASTVLETTQNTIRESNGAARFDGLTNAEKLKAVEAARGVLAKP
jgi:hypothetical protein